MFKYIYFSILIFINNLSIKIYISFPENEAVANNYYSDSEDETDEDIY